MPGRKFSTNTVCGGHQTAQGLGPRIMFQVQGQAEFASVLGKNVVAHVLGA